MLYMLLIVSCVIFLLLNRNAVLVEVGDLWRVYRGSRARLPFILHLAELMAYQLLINKEKI